MKKLVKVFLALVLGLTLVGCQSDKPKMRVHYTSQSECILIFSSEEELKNRIQKVELTKDNWNEYFSDYNIYNYNDVKDEAGNTITEKSYTFGFGLKFPVIAIYDQVSFKFDEVRVYESDVIKGKEEKDVEYTLMSSNSNLHKIYNRNGDLCNTVEIPKSEVKDYYKITLENSERHPSMQVDKASCLEASGTMYVIGSSDVTYHGDKITSIRFEGQENAIDMSMDYLKQLYENQ